MNSSEFQCVRYMLKALGGVLRGDPGLVTLSVPFSLLSSCACPCLGSPRGPRGIHWGRGKAPEGSPQRFPTGSGSILGRFWVDSGSLLGRSSGFICVSSALPRPSGWWRLALLGIPCLGCRGHAKCYSKHSRVPPSRTEQNRGIWPAYSNRAPKKHHPGPPGGFQRFPTGSGLILGRFWVDSGSILGRFWGDSRLILV